jgi:hypothetical protein
LFAVTPGRSADDVKLARTSGYFPLAVDTTWHYRVGEGRYRVKVVKHEKIGGVVAAKLESYGDKDKVISDEHVAVVADASKYVSVVRVAWKGEPVKPPMPFLKLPKDEKDEKEWKEIKDLPAWSFKGEVGGKEIKGSFQIRGIDEPVKVPAGSYRTVVVEGQNLKVLDNDLSLTYQFAEGVGMVKQTMELTKQKIVVELEKFEKPK